MSDDFALRCLDRDLRNSPTSAVVTVSGAAAYSQVTFKWKGDYVWQAKANRDGQLLNISVPIPASDAGTFVLRAEQASEYDTVSITLNRDTHGTPRIAPNDASPVHIPRDQKPTGDWPWVLQDLTAGGLGSYVMPINPSSMTSPHKARQLTAASTLSWGATDDDTRGFVWQQGYQARSWSFAGYLETPQQYRALRRFATLKRRAYIHDHRNRAWIVVILDCDMVARRDYFGPKWAHDYSVNALIYNEQPLDPE